MIDLALIGEAMEISQIVRSTHPPSCLLGHIVFIRTPQFSAVELRECLVRRLRDYDSLVWAW